MIYKLFSKLQKELFLNLSNVSNTLLGYEQISDYILSKLLNTQLVKGGSTMKLMKIKFQGP